MAWQERDDNVSGYLYLINRTKSNSYKIGLTRNLEKRFSQLQCGCPEPLKFTHTVKVPRMLDGEQSLHRKFATCRTRGEWFRFNGGQVQQVIREMNKLAGVREAGLIERILRLLPHPQFKQKGMEALAALLIIAGLGFAVFVPLPKSQGQYQRIERFAK